MYAPNGTTDVVNGILIGLCIEVYMKKRRNKKGFTLAELLIVVAIIGVLVAISIPIFTSQLEKSREATDIANIRAAYAQVAAAANSDHSHSWCATVKLKQTDKKWITDVSKAKVGGMPLLLIKIDKGNQYINVEWFRPDVKPSATGATEKEQFPYGDIYFYSDNTRLYESTVEQYDFYDATTGEVYQP